MLPHSIRLRGPWIVTADGISEPRTVRLPHDWPGFGAGRCRCIRRFGGLTRLDEHERCWLRLTDAPHVIAIELNGRPLAHAEKVRNWEIDVTSLLVDRNILSIDVHNDGSRPGWSECQLEVRGRVWLSDLSATRNEGSLLIRGATRGTAEESLDLYAIFDRQTVLTTTIQARNERQPFEFTTDFVESTSRSPLVRIELIQGSTIWHSADVPLTGS